MTHRPLTKTVSCPDGVSRLVTMDARFWRNLEWMETMGVIENGELVAQAWQTVSLSYKDTDLREKEFVSTFAHLIYTRMITLFPKSVAHKNDNKTIKPNTKKLFAKINKNTASNGNGGYPFSLPMTSSTANFNHRPDFKIANSVPRQTIARTSNQNISA